MLTTRGGPPVLGSLSERRSSRATPTYAANIAPRPAFNSARRDPPRASARLKVTIRIKDGDSSTFVAVRTEEPDEPIEEPASYRDKWRRRW